MSSSTSPLIRTLKFVIYLDPVEPEKTLAAAKQENATITHALTTHHHSDHAGGNEKLAGAVKGVQVVGGDDRIPAMNKKVLFILFLFLLFLPFLFSSPSPTYIH